MHLHAGQVHLSPTDLVNFLGCPHCTVLDHGQLTAPPRARTFSDTDALLVAKGREHERAYLDKLRAPGRAVSAVSQAADADRVGRLGASAILLFAKSCSIF